MTKMYNKEYPLMHNDATFKTLWTKGSPKTQKLLRDMVSYIVKKDVSDYKLLYSELGLENIKSRHNRLDIVLGSPDDLIKLNIELNAQYKPFVRNRNLSFLFKLAGETYAKDNYDYNQNIDVSQINFNLYANNVPEDVMLSSYELYDKEHEAKCESIKIYDVHLPNIKKICYDTDNEIYRDVAMLGALSYEELVSIASQDERRLSIVADLDKLSKDAIFMSEYEQMKYEKCVRDDGFADGKAEGLAEGKAESELNMIHAMYKNGIDFETISKVTNKTLEEVETILSAK